MNAELEVLFARRPVVNYVSPPVCEGDVSSTGGPVIVLSPFAGIGKLSNVTISGGIGPGFSFHWDDEPGDICYNIYQLVADEWVLVFECVPHDDAGVDLPGPGTWGVSPVTPDGEGPISDPVSTDEPSPPPPPSPPGECEEVGVDTSCSLAGPFASSYRIKDYQASWFDISICGMTYEDCINCRIHPDTDCVDPVEWTGTFPVHEFNFPFLQGWIDQEYEYGPFDPGLPPPSHLLHGKCITATLRSASVSNSTGCGWALRIDAYFNGSFTPLVWLGIKKKGEGPAGKYIKAAGCSPGPACLEVEAY